MIGIQQGISNRDYHTGPGISKSGITEIIKNPARYKARYIDRKTFAEPTPAMVVGTALHTLVLEPELFKSQFATDPKMPKRSNADKALWDQWQAEHQGLTLLKEEEMASINGMAAAVRAHEKANSLLAEEGQAELSIFSEIDNVLCKCRPDWLTAVGIVADLKTTEDASQEAFSRTCYNYLYHVQAALYIDVCQAVGLPVDTFMFIAVEKKAPYSVAVYQASEQMIELGRKEYQAGLDTYISCMESGVWPEYNNGEIAYIDVPKWAQGGR